jgi:hypothetical protein
VPYVGIRMMPGMGISLPVACWIILGCKPGGDRQVQQQQCRGTHTLRGRQQVVARLRQRMHKVRHGLFLRAWCKLELAWAAADTRTVTQTSKQTSKQQTSNCVGIKAPGPPLCRSAAQVLAGPLYCTLGNVCGPTFSFSASSAA